MSVYRLYVRPHNAQNNQEAVEFFVRAENAREAVMKALETTPGLKEFGAISVDNIPSGVIVE